MPPAIRCAPDPSSSPPSEPLRKTTVERIPSASSTESKTVPKFHCSQRLIYTIWAKTGKKPNRVTAIAENPAERGIPRFIDLPDVDDHLYDDDDPNNDDDKLQVWLPLHASWMVSMREDLPFVIESTARNVLMRYPGAINCLGFPHALRMLKDERRVDLGPDEWDYVDLRLQYSRIQNGDQMTVVAYGVDAQPPVFFFVTLTKTGELRWRSYPQLLRHIMGPAECPAGFEVWTVGIHNWEFVHPNEDLVPADGYDFILVRHKANASAIGLPHFLSLLDQQTHTPVIRFPFVALMSDPSGAAETSRVLRGRTKDLWPVMIPALTYIPPQTNTLRHPVYAPSIPAPIGTTTPSSGQSARASSGLSTHPSLTLRLSPDRTSTSRPRKHALSTSNCRQPVRRSPRKLKPSPNRAQCTEDGLLPLRRSPCKPKPNKKYDPATLFTNGSTRRKKSKTEV